MSFDLVRLNEAKELAQVGGKAASLGSLQRNDIKTVGGFVVTTAAFDKMSVQLEKEILKAFNKLNTDFVAVRSSAVAEDGQDSAWAGQLETFLNVGRGELIDAIQKCWAGATSERALSYAKQKNITAGKVAVIIQPMIQSDASGIAFSANPVTKNSRQIIIEAGLGLGEAVVSGDITPDTYIVDKKSGSFLEKHISLQQKKLVLGDSGKNEWLVLEDANYQKISDGKIKELARTVTKLEELYGHAVDVEWLIKDSGLFIMQCRPITTL